jgi:hypothetical protein
MNTDTRQRALAIVKAMPDLHQLDPLLDANKVAIRLKVANIYKTHSITGILSAAPNLIREARGEIIRRHK